LGGDDLLFVKWPTPRGRLSAGLAQDWSCVRDVLKAAQIDRSDAAEAASLWIDVRCSTPSAARSR
jgi:hypothetical protein